MKQFLILLNIFFLVSCVTESKFEEGSLSSPKMTQSEAKKEKSKLHLSIGKNLEKHGKLIRATESYQSSIRENPYNHKAHFALGKVLLERQFKEKGLEEIKTALSLKPDYTEARNFLAYYYEYENKGLSYKYINKSSKDLVYPNQEETWALKFYLDTFFVTSEKAMSSGLKALSSKAQSCSQRLLISKSFYRIEAYKKALKASRQAKSLCQSQEEKAQLNYIGALIFLKKGHLRVAKELLLEMKTQDPILRVKVPKIVTAINKKIERVK